MIDKPRKNADNKLSKTFDFSTTHVNGDMFYLKSYILMSSQPLFLSNESLLRVQTFIEVPSTLCLRKDTDVAHYNFDEINQF